MRLKSLLIGAFTILLVGAGAAWSVGSNGGDWAWKLAPKVAGYVPDPKDINFYYPLPEVVEETSPFGYRIHPIHGDRRLHAGMDLGAPEGMPVLSAHSGYVRYADWGDGYGKMVIVEYADGKYQTLYAHLSEILVSEGEAVRPRQVIGKVGSTGGVTGPHLHFELLRQEGGEFVAIDPAPQVKAVEAFVAVRPPDSAPATTETAIAAQPPAPPKSDQPWEAPAMDSTAPPQTATADASSAQPMSPFVDQNGVINFNP
ncbi:MAG: peptidoglycan DD-metalloendopeptidase family protein [Leptolyngbyaceae cyanobacterium bins.349]|nr:peptidoglycan DD-metalloendopeptidase family protein [Leptolyngbyaceae cyanobacterium bins.349]